MSNPIDSITENIDRYPCLVLGVKGNGKSTLVKSLVQHIKTVRPEITFKIFDISYSWFDQSPEAIPYRQVVTVESIKYGITENIGDCVYTLNMHSSDRLDFITSILKEDMDKRERYILEKGTLAFNKFVNPIVYIFEEVSEIFNSYLLNGNSLQSEILRHFLNVSRNLKINLGLGLAVQSVGSISPKLRRISSMLCTRLESESDYRNISAKYGYRYRDSVHNLDRYEFLYSGDYSNTIKLSSIPNFHKPTEYKKNPYRLNKYEGNQVESMVDNSGDKPSIIDTVYNIIKSLAILYFLSLFI